MTWRSRCLPNGQCLLAHWPHSARRWRNVVDLVICAAHRIPADTLADAALRQFPGSLLAVAVDARSGATVRTRDGQHGAVADTGVDVEHTAVLIYAWLTTGQPLAAVL